MDARIRAFDWSRTPLGPMERWPEALRTALRLMLGSRYPMFVWWGEHLTNFYNDGYIPVLGARHPDALGRSAREVWHEVWDTLGPQAEQVLRSGQATYDEELFLGMERYGFREETYFTYSYSPVRGPDGVAGVFCACFEDTRRVLGERRLRVLRELAVAAQDAESADEACEISASVLARHRKDVPFALLYLREEGGRIARLAASASIEPGGPASPGLIALGAHEPWPLGATPLGGDPVPIACGERGDALPSAWPEPVQNALVLPIAYAGQLEPAGWLVMGLSPLLRFDRDYAAFAQLLAGAMASSLAAARAYEDERRRAEALAELDRAKTVFFSNVSHEFRTPLTLMLGPLEDALAEGGEELGPRTRERLVLAHRNSQRLLKLVNTLLDFARIEAGRIDAAYEPADLATLTTDVANQFRAAVERGGLGLTVACEPLPEPVYVDREMWEKIVLNLLSNAFKFTFEGTIEVALAARGGRVELVVSDTGTGIPASELPHLFERFRRVKGARARSDEGTGIGLALVQELARLHGGTVRVESAVGRGSRFTVSLPFGRAHLPPDRIGAPHALASTSLGARPFVEEALRWLPESRLEAPLGGLGEPVGGAASGAARVLVADDNADLRAYLRQLLGRQFTVETAANGREALEAARESRPDLVVADVMMPELDGFALLAALRADPVTRDTPVILLSARAGEEARIEGLGAGADDYLVKPFNARELIATVRAHIELARMRREKVEAAERSARRLRILADLSATLSRTLEPGETLHQLARAVVPALADWCFVDAVSVEGEVRRMACEAADPADAGIRERLAGMRLDPERRDSLRDELRLGRTRFFAEVDEAWCRAHARDEAHLETLLAMAIRSVVLVPLVAHGKHYGVLTFVTSRSGRRYAEAELPFLEEIGARASLALEHAHLFEEARRESEESERARREAEAANRAKDDFLAVLSHELRAPLQSIFGWVTLLKDEPLDLAQARRAVEAVERSARSQARLIDDLLEVSRIVSGKFAIDRAALSLGGIVESAAEQLVPMARDKGVSLDCDVSGPGSVLGDRERLIQVVTNLLTNAIRFTPRGGRIEVRCAEREGAVVLTVRDTGPGIPPEFLPDLFRRFTQADASSTRRHGGLGLGLAIASHIVEAHGGTILAESPGPGEGATFTVRLPLAQRGLFEGAAGSGTLQDDRARQLDGANVLLVEDDADSREALSFALARRGARVRSVSSVREAVAACREEPPELVVSDLGMPEEDGYSLPASLRELGLGDTPLIALTGFASADDRRRALRTGFLAHVAKPVDSDELATLLKRVLPRRRAG